MEDLYGFIALVAFQRSPKTSTCRHEYVGPLGGLILGQIAGSTCSCELLMKPKPNFQVHVPPFLRRS
jgi:hypothetical protein